MGFHENFKGWVHSVRLSRPIHRHVICCAPSRDVLERHWNCCKDAYAAGLHCLMFFLVYIPLLVTGPCVCNRALWIKTEVKQRRQERGFSSIVHNSFILYSRLHLILKNLHLLFENQNDKCTSSWHTLGSWNKSISNNCLTAMCWESWCREFKTVSCRTCLNRIDGRERSWFVVIPAVLLCWFFLNWILLASFFTVVDGRFYPQTKF